MPLVQPSGYACTRVGNAARTHGERHVALAGARRPSSPVPPVCAPEFPRSETFSSQQQSSRMAELLPNDVPDRYFVSRINKAATLHDSLVLPSAFHRLCKATPCPRRCPLNLSVYLSACRVRSTILLDVQQRCNARRKFAGNMKVKSEARGKLLRHHGMKYKRCNNLFDAETCIDRRGRFWELGYCALENLLAVNLCLNTINVLVSDF